MATLSVVLRCLLVLLLRERLSSYIEFSSEVNASFQPYAIDSD